MEEQLAEKIAINAQDLRELMQARAGAVQKYLLQSGLIAAERLFILTPKPDGAMQPAGSRANLSLN